MNNNPKQLLSVKEQVDQIRREVRHHGETVATCETLRLLCEDQGTFSQQFARLRDIATQEGWRFVFGPDGSVRFSTLTEKTEVLSKCAEVQNSDSSVTMFTNKASVMNWWCPTCTEKITEPISFFLSEPCRCLHCKAVMNMEGLLNVMEATRQDSARR